MASSSSARPSSLHTTWRSAASVEAETGTAGMETRPPMVLVFWCQGWRTGALLLPEGC